MEKSQLLELMDSAIQLDQQLQEWMKEKESRLAEHSQALEEQLPLMVQQRRATAEAELQRTILAANAEIEKALTRIEAEKHDSLQAIEQKFVANRKQIIQKITDKIRGDELG